MDGLNEILELINDQNDVPVEITESNVVIGTPQILTPYSVNGQGDRNTSVKLTGIPYSGYVGDTNVYYKRGDIDKLFTGLSPKIRSREFNADGVLATINNRYGLKLEMRDLKDFTVPAFTIEELETSKFITFEAIDQSYRWLGKITIELRFGNPKIETVVFVQLLPMLSHPEKVELLAGRYSGRMATYGFDFTPWKDQLVIDPETGHWADFATVQEIVGLSGLSYWYNGPVIDLPTSAVEDANTDFQRVMVQNITKGTVKGPLYLHYDVSW